MGLTNHVRVLVHIAAVSIGVVVLPLLTIEHETVGQAHVLRVDCYLFRAASDYDSDRTCVALIDKINHDNSVPHLVVGEDAAVIASEVYALAVATICLHLVGALLRPIGAIVEDRYHRKPKTLESWATFATCASVATGWWTLDTAQRWSREHDAATPDMSATYASLGGATYVIVGLPLVSTIILASQQG